MKPSSVKQKTNVFIGVVTVIVFIITTGILYWKLSSVLPTSSINPLNTDVSHNGILHEIDHNKTSYTLNTQFRTEQNTAVKPLDNIHKAAYAMAAKFRCGSLKSCWRLMIKLWCYDIDPCHQRRFRYGMTTVVMELNRDICHLVRLMLTSFDEWFVIILPYPPLQETTTNTYNGHVFFFTEFGNRDNELARFTMNPNKVLYIPHWLSVLTL
jgi:hypothetical protein